MVEDRLFLQFASSFKKAKQLRFDCHSSNYRYRLSFQDPPLQWSFIFLLSFQPLQFSRLQRFFQLPLSFRLSFQLRRSFQLPLSVGLSFPPLWSFRFRRSSQLQQSSLPKLFYRLGQFFRPPRSFQLCYPHRQFYRQVFPLKQSSKLPQFFRLQRSFRLPQSFQLKLFFRQSYREWQWLVLP
jgi:hypothetical protein